MRNKIFPIFGLSILLASCSDMNLPESSELGGLRVLAITTQSSQAEFSPGDSVTLRPLVSYINFSGTLTYSAEGCVDPGVSIGAAVSCDNNATKADLGSGTISTLTASDSMTGYANDVTLTLPASTVMFQSRSSQDQYNGVSYLVIYNLSSSDGKTVKSFKRILVSNKASSEKNNNPVFSDILQDGASLASISYGSKTQLSASIGVGSAETFNLQKSDGTIDSETEEILISWYISDGNLKYIRTTDGESTEFEAPSAAPSGRKIFVIGVARDERGGQSALIRSF